MMIAEHRLQVGDYVFVHNGMLRGWYAEYQDAPRKVKLIRRLGRLLRCERLRLWKMNPIFGIAVADSVYDPKKKAHFVEIDI